MEPFPVSKEPRGNFPTATRARRQRLKRRRAATLVVREEGHDAAQQLDVTPCEMASIDPTSVCNKPTMCAIVQRLSMQQMRSIH
ncbi:hypothetical protein E2562_038214 [Oryza meyeriana var. granulata]|uniref:Uncharacterized protein n=1 Tax=Oryza meyeriana var. granulata TaxID=110450 RepID=A0A6G1EUC2_9ORYZ|nr:hypothetical protein E2562_038214 [Oryza meyeriana var. granulata]